MATRKGLTPAHKQARAIFEEIIKRLPELNEEGAQELTQQGGAILEHIGITGAELCFTIGQLFGTLPPPPGRPTGAPDYSLAYYLKDPGTAPIIAKLLQTEVYTPIQFAALIAALQRGGKINASRFNAAGITRAAGAIIGQERTGSAKALRKQRHGEFYKLSIERFCNFLNIPNTFKNEEHIYNYLRAELKRYNNLNDLQRGETQPD